jgi:hypothetical protein
LADNAPLNNKFNILLFLKGSFWTKNHARLQLISDKIQIIRFYLSLVRSVAYGESEVKLFACKEIINRWQFSFSKGEKWYDKPNPVNNADN